MMINVFIDGASRGNPGFSSCAFVIMNETEIIEERGFYLGKISNNQAEYSGLLMGLLAAKEKHLEAIQIMSDSELLVKQLDGQYRVKSPNLLSYYELYSCAKGWFSTLSVEHIPREENTRADRLCNLILNLNKGKEIEKEVSLDTIRELYKRNTRRS